MKTTVRLLLIAALAVSVAACCSCRKGRKNAKPLTGTTWSLVEWRGRPFQAKDNYRLVFGTEEGRFGGRGDCNSIMGNYSVTDKGGMKIESVASTRAFCPDQAQEDRFIKELDRIDSYRIDGDLLMLMRDGELLMVMQAQPSAE